MSHNLHLSQVNTDSKTVPEDAMYLLSKFGRTNAKLTSKWHRTFVEDILN